MEHCLFGLRSNEHRLLRVSNIILKDNFIIFDESVSKTFHGGLRDLKKTSKFIKHKCHELGQSHGRCLQSLYRLYLGKIAQCVKAKPDSFYFSPQRNGTFEYEKSAVGINSLNKILPDKLCSKAGLPRKTSHSLRITCATRLFQSSVNDKQIRERTGHTSNSLLRYEKPSDEQVSFVSNVLSAPNSFKPIENPSLDSLLDDVSDEILSGIDLSNIGTNNENFPNFEISDEVLCNLDLDFPTNNQVQNTTSSSVTTNGPVFNNCTFNCNSVFQK